MGIDLIGTIQPKNNGAFPTHDAKYGKGGFISVVDAAERDLIPALNRTVGMHVHVVANGVTYNLGAGLTNADWTPISSGGASVITQADWYIDPGFGSDSADGSVATPLRSWAGLLAKWGVQPKLNVAGFVTVNLLGNLAASDPVDVTNILLGKDTNLLIKGQATAARVGTLTASTALNRATNTPCLIDDTGRDWTPEIGKRLENATVGPNFNAHAWVAKSVGGISARISPPALTSVPTTAGYPLPTSAAFLVGDTYRVQDLTQIYLSTIDHVSRHETDYAVHPGRVYFQDIYFRGLAATLFRLNVSTIVIGCQFEGGAACQVSEQSFINCGFGSTDGVGSSTGNIALIAGLSLGGIIADNNSVVNVSADFLSQGNPIIVDGGGTITLDQVGVFDSTSAAVSVSDDAVYNGEGGTLRCTAVNPIYGSGSTGVGVLVGALGRFFSTSSPSVTGALGDLSLFGHNVIPWAVAPRGYTGEPFNTTCITLDATPLRVRRYPVADGGVRSLRFIVTARSTDNTGAVMGEWEVKAGYKRITGTLSQGYVPVITPLFLVGLPPGPTITLNGNTDVDLNVTGIAATNLTWAVSEFSL